MSRMTFAMCDSFHPEMVASQMVCMLSPLFIHHNYSLGGSKPLLKGGFRL